MGMPIIMPGDTTLDQAVTDLIISVAMQETSLSHILNAEGKDGDDYFHGGNISGGPDEDEPVCGTHNRRGHKAGADTPE